jgi:hypothetical protein
VRAESRRRPSGLIISINLTRLVRCLAAEVKGLRPFLGVLRTLRSQTLDRSKSSGREGVSLLVKPFQFNRLEETAARHPRLTGSSGRNHIALAVCRFAAMSQNEPVVSSARSTETSPNSLLKLV